VSVTTRKTYLCGLDWLRFGLAIYLVLFHTLPAYSGLPQWLYTSVSVGYVSTSLFFILSGYVLAHLYLDDRGKLLISGRKFMGIRLLTLYPIHVVGFLLAAGNLGLQYMATGNAMAVADIPPALQASTQEPLLIPLDNMALALNTVAHLLLIHAWNPLYQTFNIPSWSISTLVFFYIVFVTLGGWFFRTSRPWIRLIALMAIYILPTLLFVVTADYRPVVTGLLHTNPLIRLPEFLAGIVLCRILRDRPQTIQRPVLTAGFALVLIAVLVALLSQLGPAGYYLLHNGALLPFELLLIAACARLERSPWPRIDRQMAKLAGATLSIFILHQPLFSILTRFQKWIIAASDGDATSWPDFLMRVKTAPLYFSIYPLLLVAIIALSLVSQEYIVKKVRRYLREKISPSHRGPASDLSNWTLRSNSVVKSGD
jgi:peptidoglycan/LPS O-acetylase OafA/YrhL